MTADNYPAIHFPKITLKRPLIPYTDLKAQGGFTDWLDLPADIIPTLSLQTLIKNDQLTNLWTGKHIDGAADVYVVGQSGGGGLAGKATYDQNMPQGANALTAGHALNIQFPLAAACTAITGFEWTVTYEGAALATSARVTCTLNSGGGNPPAFSIAVVGFDTASANGTQIHQFYQFTPAIDIIAMGWASAHDVYFEFEVNCNCDIAYNFLGTV